MKKLSILFFVLYCGAVIADTNGFKWESTPNTVSPKPMAVPSLSVTDPNPYQDNLRQSQVDRVHRKLGIKGAGVKIGINSTGVTYQHEALTGYAGRLPDGSYDHNYAWFDAFQVFLEPRDGPQIGTHISGVVAGRMNHIGVAPEAAFISCRAYDSLGYETTESQNKCLNFFAAPHDVYGQNPRPELRPDVVLTTYSDVSIGDVLYDGVRKLRDAGVVVITNAGSRHTNHIICARQGLAPTFYPNVFTVGASQRVDGTVSLLNTSGGGPIFDASGQIVDTYFKPDAVAPGREYLSSGYPNGQSLYVTASGTLVGAAHVTGIAALVISANPALKRRVRDVEEILRHAADPTGLATTDCLSTQSVPNNVTGYGSINAYAAVKRAVEFPYGGCPIKPVGPANCSATSTSNLAISRTVPSTGLAATKKSLSFDFRSARNLNDFGSLDRSSGQFLSLCLYDTPDPMSGDTEPFLKGGFKIPFGTGTHGTWQQTSRNEWFFGANGNGSDGIKKVRINTRSSVIDIVGDGEDLPLSRTFSISGRRMFDAYSGVIAQLHSSETGKCWNSSFTPTNILKNNEETLRVSKTGV
jgi:subtilisin family serine protease